MSRNFDKTWYLNQFSWYKIIRFSFSFWKWKKLFLKHLCHEKGLKKRICVFSRKLLINESNILSNICCLLEKLYSFWWSNMHRNSPDHPLEICHTWYNRIMELWQIIIGHRLKLIWKRHFWHSSYRSRLCRQRSFGLFQCR